MKHDVFNENEVRKFFTEMMMKENPHRNYTLTSRANGMLILSHNRNLCCNDDDDNDVTMITFR